MKKECVSSRCYKQTQSWWFERILKFTSPVQSFKLRIVIRRNAFDFQSYGHVDMWDGNKWNNVIDVPITELESRKVDYVTLNVTERDFENDCKSLLETALKIVA